MLIFKNVGHSLKTLGYGSRDISDFKTLRQMLFVLLAALFLG
jgi:hypothetical protein